MSPACAVCGEVATCIGRYNGEDEDSYSCDECCDHSNEDGKCRMLKPEEGTT